MTIIVRGNDELVRTWQWRHAVAGIEVERTTTRGASAQVRVQNGQLRRDKGSVIQRRLLGGRNAVRDVGHLEVTGDDSQLPVARAVVECGEFHDEDARDRVAIVV